MGKVDKNITKENKTPVNELTVTTFLWTIFRLSGASLPNWYYLLSLGDLEEGTEGHGRPPFFRPNKSTQGRGILFLFQGTLLSYVSPLPLKVNSLEDLNPPLASVSAFRKMKIYTFVLGVIKSTAFTQQILAIALKYLFAVPTFLCIQMSAISMASRGEKENRRPPNGKQN